MVAGERKLTPMEAISNLRGFTFLCGYYGEFICQ
jgi:hypothetical protein